jgi:hypothetical protein
MGRRALQSGGVLLLALDFGHVDAPHFFLRVEIDHGEAVIVRQLNVDIFRGAISLGVERHRPYARTGRQLPRNGLRRLIDHRQHASRDRA